jgi:hypothetical protein
VLIASLALIVCGLLLASFARAIHRFNLELTKDNPLRAFYWPRYESEFYVVLGRSVGIFWMGLGFWLLVTRVLVA